jgi:hypothetical protein
MSQQERPTCPECGVGKRLPMLVTRYYEDIPYEAWIERCDHCGESCSGSTAALAEVQAIRDDGRYGATFGQEFVRRMAARSKGKPVPARMTTEVELEELP